MTGDSQYSDWFTPGRFAGLLALMVAGSFPGIVTGGESFVLRDYSLFGYPLAHFHRECFWNGEWPLWNPYNHCGLPFLAQWNTLCLYPLSLIYLLLPLTWGLGLFCLVHLYAGGFGMYRLMRARTGCGFAGAVAGVLFAFGGFTQTALMWPNNSAALGWLPWVLLLLDSGVRRGGRWLFGAALVGGMQMLSGAPELILLTWVIGLAVWLSRLCDWRRELVRFAIIVALVSALAAAQLLPFLELLARSSRGVEDKVIWAMAADGWCHLFVPLYRTVHVPSGFWMQTDQFWTVSYYTGIGGVLFAAMAWRSRTHRFEVAVWLLIALGGLAMASGENGIFYSCIDRFLPLRIMRYPVKFVSLLCVCVPVLAGFGVAGLPRNGTDRDPRRLGLEWWIVTGLVILVMTRIPDSWKFGELRRDWMDSALLRIGTLAALGLALGGRGAFGVRVWGIAVLVICLVDLSTHSPGITATVPAATYDAAHPGDLPRLGEGRIAASPSVGDGLRKGMSRDHVQEAAVRRKAGLSDLNLAMGVPSVDGFYSLRLSYERETTRRLHRSKSETHGPLADFMGISRIVIADERGMAWRKRGGAEPLVAVGRKPQFVPDDKLLQYLASDSFDPSRELLLPAAMKSRIDAGQDLAATVFLQLLGNNELAFETSATKPIIATIAQTWHPNWRVKVDGRPAELLRVNHSFQGVAVPAGRHTVELHYVDRRFQVGAIVSGLTLAGVLMGLLRRRQKRSAVLVEPPAVPLLL